jgi:hypothetical protein
MAGIEHRLPERGVECATSRAGSDAKIAELIATLIPNGEDAQKANDKH